MTLYIVSTVTRDEEGHPTEIKRCGYDDKIKAMSVAKGYAFGAKDCLTYGPSSIAFYGNDVTAVVSW